MGWDPNQGQQPPADGQNFNTQGADPNAYPNPGYSQPSQQGYDPNAGQQYQSGYSNQPYSSYQAPQYGAAASASSQWGPTSMGMDANVSAGLSYIVGLVTGLVFYFVEKQNHFVRFHAAQSTIFSGAVVVLWAVLFFLSTFITLAIGGILSFGFGCLYDLVILASVVYWLFVMIMAFMGRYYKIPLVSGYAEKMAAARPM